MVNAKNLHEDYAATRLTLKRSFGFVCETGGSEDTNFVDNSLSVLFSQTFAALVKTLSWKSTVVSIV